MSEENIQKENVIIDAVQIAIAGETALISKEDALLSANRIAQLLSADNTLIVSGEKFFDLIVGELAGKTVPSCIRIYGQFGLRDSSILPAWIPFFGTDFVELSVFCKNALSKDEYNSIGKFFNGFHFN